MNSKRKVVHESAKKENPIYSTRSPAEYLSTRHEVPLNLLLGTLDPEAQIATKAAIPHGSEAIDVGAHYGLYSFAFSRAFRKVWVLEPNPECVEFLRPCLPKNTTLVAKAASCASGTAELIEPTRNEKGLSGLSSLEPHKADGNYRTLTVETVAIDDLDIGALGLIKVDVEGHEAAVLEGAANTIAHCKPVLVLELEDFHLGGSGTALRLFEEVCQMGYKGFVADGGQLAAATVSRFDRESPDFRNNFVFMPE